MRGSVPRKNWQKFVIKLGPPPKIQKFLFFHNVLKMMTPPPLESISYIFEIEKIVTVAYTRRQTSRKAY